MKRADAKGPVEVERMPGEVVITYRMKNGANLEQHLQLPPGGIAQNHIARDARQTDPKARPVRSLGLAAGLALFAAAPAAAAEKPMLDMLAFFAGRTHADNVLKVVFKKPVRLIVDSVGGRGDRGDFVLIDTVHEGDKPVRQRKWIMRQSGPGHFTGSLTDATGPVDIAVSRDTATITYMMKGGLKVEQELQLQPDGKTLRNHVVAKKLGLKFAHVDGTVRKLD
jgi:hypothetical protein